MTNLVKIIFEDDDFYVFDKPFGISTIPAPDESNDLTKLVNEQYGTKDRLWPAHRLDKDTSGAIIFCKGKANQKWMMGQFSQNKPSKIYIALVNGNLTRDSGVIKNPINKQEAITQYQVLERRAQTSLLKIKLHTGRTNQIRIHLSEMGHPLIGDYRFGERKSFSVKHSRTLLHAYFIEFLDKKNRSQSVTVPLAADFSELLSELNYSLNLT